MAQQAMARGRSICRTPHRKLTPNFPAATKLAQIAPDGAEAGAGAGIGKCDAATEGASMALEVDLITGAAFPVLGERRALGAAGTLDWQRREPGTVNEETSREQKVLPAWKTDSFGKAADANPTLHGTRVQDAHRWY
jgi:hypothetical protein